MMTEDEVRDFFIRAINPRTARDNQLEVGASNLSNPCDRCLAHEIDGTPRVPMFLDAAWGGRVIGTAIHSHVERNLRRADSDASDTDLGQLALQFPGAQVERQVKLGALPGGRLITSTLDVFISSEGVLTDVKNTDMRKLAFIRDRVAVERGEDPIFGRGHQYTKVFYEKEPELFVQAVKGVSEAVYEKELVHAGYKLERYSNQEHLYALGLTNEGIGVSQLFTVFVARDSAMTLENRDSARYLEERAPRGIVAIEMEFDPARGEVLWQRAVDITQALLDGATPDSFDAHLLCDICADEEKRLTEAPDPEDIPVVVPAAVDPWAA